jgi:hypothetical protein
VSGRTFGALLHPFGRKQKVGDECSRSIGSLLAAIGSYWQLLAGWHFTRTLHHFTRTLHL